MTDYDLFTRPRRRLVWFSCGAPSAVAAKLAVDKYGDSVEVIYCNTFAKEHPDNRRFFEDVQQWIGQEIKILSSIKFADIDEVFEKSRYMSGTQGAKCTVEMKKVPRFRYQKPDDIHIFGMSIEERKRIRKFENNNHELCLEWILLDWNLSKKACKEMVAAAGIEIPMMYKLGYQNNNCPGCVKSASPAYWNRTRRDFPEVFQRRCEQSRAIGCKLVKVTRYAEGATRGHQERIFLDELDPLCMESPPEDLSCGPQCRGANS